MSSYTPPRLLEHIAGWAVPAGLSGQGTLGDLAEEFGRRARTAPMRARFWYARQTLSLVTYRFFTKRRSAGTTTTSDLRMDLEWSLRTLIKHPGFAIGVVGVLGLGLAANAAVFSVMDGTLRNTVWWSEPDATVAIWPDHRFSFGQLEMYAEEQTAYRTVGGYVELAFAVRTASGESQSINGVMVTPALFRELAVQPFLGRPLEDSDAIFGTEAVVVIGASLWQRSFGSDPDILGTRIDVAGSSATVVGVQGPGGMAPGGRAELWFPLTMDPRDDDFWKAASHTMIGVLENGLTLDHAQADLMAFTERLSDLFPMFYPPGYARGIANVARADASQRSLVSTPLILLLAGTALLMLVTALNVGNLLLGRAINRRTELAVRSSLGAGTGRIVRQLLVEGLVLTAIAVTLGLTTGALGSRWVAGLFVEQAVVTNSSIFSPTVLLYSLLVSALAWLVLSGAPILHFLRSQRASINVKPNSGSGLQRGLVVIQAALATLLLVSATLLVATVDNLRQVPLGFDPPNMLTFELSPPETVVASPSVARQYYDRLVERVSAVPGIHAAGLTGWLPLRSQAPTTPINLRAAQVDPREAVTAPMHMVDPGFFETFGVNAIEGRLLGIEDRETTPSAVVVNESLAETLWPNGSAIGQMIAIDPHAWFSWVPVVGVVPDIRSGEITGPIGPALYVSIAESPARDVTLVVRTDGAPANFIATLRRTVRDVDPLVPIRAIAPMIDVVRAAYSTAWIMMGLLTVLAGLATALGAIGIYAVLAHHVVLNRKEIGIRLALGATPTAVVKTIVRSGVLLAAVGIVVGGLSAAVTMRFIESLLYEVSALAPWAFLAPAVALAGAAALAAWVPATRAGRLPPADVLRTD